MKYKAAVGYDMGMGHMTVDQVQVFETKTEAEDWIEFMFNMSSEYDMAEINPINK
jgi:hypothetical protein